MNRGLIDKFYKGECSEEEVRIVQRWFQAKEISHEQEQELHALWQEAGQEAAVEEHVHDSNRVLSKIKSLLPQPQQGESTTTRSLQLQQSQFWFKAAAAVLLPLLFIWVLVQYVSYPKTTAAEYTAVEAAPGMKKTINLPDGSVIRLNAGSKVSFRKDFIADKREIVLQGEAFFEVAKDSLRPFIVHTGNVSTHALGTSFNINFMSNEDLTVALATGIVKVDRQEQGHKRQLAKLVPGQQLSFNKISKQYTVAAFNRNETLGWKDGVLYFKEADLAQIINKLENWYGVDIEVDTHGMQEDTWSYTGEYDNETLDKVLEGVSFVKGFSYERNGKNINIVFNSIPNK